MDVDLEYQPSRASVPEGDGVEGEIWRYKLPEVSLPLRRFDALVAAANSNCLTSDCKSTTLTAARSMQMFQGQLRSLLSRALADSQRLRGRILAGSSPMKPVDRHLIGVSPILSGPGTPGNHKGLPEPGGPRLLTKGSTSSTYSSVLSCKCRESLQNENSHGTETVSSSKCFDHRN
jgi:hypothetical protein